MNKLAFTVAVAAVVGAVALATPAFAGEVIVTPGDVSISPGSWHPANERDGGVSSISDELNDALGGVGSLRQYLPAPDASSPKSDFEVFSSDTTFVIGEGLKTTSGGFGSLSVLTQLGFDWYRDSSSTAPDHLTPAFRVYLWDPDVGTHGASYLAIWEGVYNGYPAIGGPVPTDTWITEDVASEFFWLIPQFIDGAWAGFGGCGIFPCFQFNKTLGDWGLGANTQIIGVNVGLGSGWAGSYLSYADFVEIGFGVNPATVWNFAYPAQINCDGFQSPMDKTISVKKKNRVLPLKMVCTDGDGKVLGDADIAAPLVEVDFSGGGSGTTPEDVYLTAGQGDEGNIFSYSNGVWQFNLQTKNFNGTGTYAISAVSGAPSDYQISPSATGTFVVQ